MDDPHGEPRYPLPPSRFGAGYTVGDGTTESPPTHDYPVTYPPPAAEPPAPGSGSVRYPAPEPPAPSVGPAQYPPTPVQYPVMAAPVGYVAVAKTNSMAIAALVCSLVLAPLGVVFGHIALSQIKRTGEDGRGLAIAGLVIGYIFTAIAVLWFIVFMVFLGALGSAINDSTYYDSDYTYSMGATALPTGLHR